MRSRLRQREKGKEDAEYWRKPSGTKLAICLIPTMQCFYAYTEPPHRAYSLLKRNGTRLNALILQAPVNGDYMDLIA